MDEEIMFIGWPFLIPIVAIIGGITYSIINSNNRARVREMEIRERIAMIEKGLVPPPEVDPERFDRAGFDRGAWRHDYAYARPARTRRAGVTLIGIGLGLAFMLTTITGEDRIGYGVGGFLVIFGLALMISSLVEGSAPPSQK